MPYITQRQRDAFDCAIEQLVADLEGVSNDDVCGELNYIFSKIIWSLCGHKTDNVCRYFKINMILGAMEAAKLEFYRRIAVPYEDQKIRDNGDI